jgi:hypothetical protein
VCRTLPEKISKLTFKNPNITINTRCSCRTLWDINITIMGKDPATWIAGTWTLSCLHPCGLKCPWHAVCSPCDGWCWAIPIKTQIYHQVPSMYLAPSRNHWRVSTWRCNKHSGAVVPAAIHIFFGYRVHWLLHPQDIPQYLCKLLLTASTPKPRIAPNRFHLNKHYKHFLLAHVMYIFENNFIRILSLHGFLLGNLS